MVSVEELTKRVEELENKVRLLGYQAQSQYLEMDRVIKDLHSLKYPEEYNGN